MSGFGDGDLGVYDDEVTSRELETYFDGSMDAEVHGAPFVLSSPCHRYIAEGYTATYPAERPRNNQDPNDEACFVFTQGTEENVFYYVKSDGTTGRPLIRHHRVTGQVSSHIICQRYLQGPVPQTLSGTVGVPYFTEQWTPDTYGVFDDNTWQADQHCAMYGTVTDAYCPSGRRRELETHDSLPPTTQPPPSPPGVCVANPQCYASTALPFADTCVREGASTGDLLQC